MSSIWLSSFTGRSFDPAARVPSFQERAAAGIAGKRGRAVTEHGVALTLELELAAGHRSRAGAHEQTVAVGSRREEQVAVDLRDWIGRSRRRDVVEERDHALHQLGEPVERR